MRHWVQLCVAVRASVCGRWVCVDLRVCTHMHLHVLACTHMCINILNLIASKCCRPVVRLRHCSLSTGLTGSRGSISNDKAPANLISPSAWLVQLQPQEISPPPTADLDRSNDRVYENVTGLVKAVIEMSYRIQPAAPEEYVAMVKVRDGDGIYIFFFINILICGKLYLIICVCACLCVCYRRWV